MPAQLPKSGNRIIDAHHQRLYDLIGRAAALSRANAAGTEVAATAQQFLDLLVHHCRMESMIAAGAGFSGIPEHADRHREILGQTGAMIAALNGADNAERRFALVDHMEHILYDHEILEDCRYWHTLRDLAGQVADGRQPAWAPSLSIGIERLDQQHRRMISLLAAAIARGREPDRIGEVGQLLEGFVALAHRHFRDEEAELARTGHAVGHRRRLLDSLQEAAAAYRDRPDILVTDYLPYWLLDHMRGPDRADFVARSSIGTA